MIKNKCFKSSIAALSIISLSVMSTFVAMATSQNDSDSSVLMKNVVESDTNILSIDGSVDLEEKITLCDMKGTLYAYFIPVVDNAQNKISGYSVVSAVGTPKTLVTAIGDNAASLSVAIMSAFESTGEMIYEFPSAFITKNGDNYYKICMDGSLNEILNPSDYESSTVEFLKSEIPQTNSTKATTVYGQLDDWDTGAFLPIKDDGGGIYYGGYQGWLTNVGVSEFYANRSCGVTAASNMFCYMSSHVSGMKGLYTKSGITKSEFNAFQKDVYDTISPAVWGIPTVDSLISRAEEFASNHKVDLKATRSSSAWSEVNVRKYIATGLNKESPVLLLTWNSPIPDLEQHWVTVTRIYDAGSGTKMVTSNWAGKEIYDFPTWVNGGSLYKGVIYFE